MVENIRYKVNEPEVISETIDNEVIVINFENGNYYSIDKTGVDIWQLIESGTSVSQIVQFMNDKYDGDHEIIKASVTKYIDELLEENLIVPNNKKDYNRASDGATVFNLESDKPEFEYPVLHKYTDMSELLLLDPIHEVDEAGWPFMKQDPGDDEK